MLHSFGVWPFFTPFFWVRETFYAASQWVTLHPFMTIDIFKSTTCSACWISADHDSSTASMIKDSLEWCSVQCSFFFSVFSNTPYWPKIHVCTFPLPPQVCKLLPLLDSQKSRLLLLMVLLKQQGCCARHFQQTMLIPENLWNSFTRRLGWTWIVQEHQHLTLPALNSEISKEWQWRCHGYFQHWLPFSHSNVGRSSYCKLYFYSRLTGGWLVLVLSFLF